MRDETPPPPDLSRGEYLSLKADRRTSMWSISVPASHFLLYFSSARKMLFSAIALAFLGLSASATPMVERRSLCTTSCPESTISGLPLHNTEYSEGNIVCNVSDSGLPNLRATHRTDIFATVSERLVRRLQRLHLSEPRSSKRNPPSEYSSLLMVTDSLAQEQDSSGTGGQVGFRRAVSQRLRSHRSLYFL